MKTGIIKSLLALVLVLGASLAYSQSREEREVPGFSGISLGISADLYLSQGSPQQVIVQAEQEDLARIETAVKDGRLKIRCIPSVARIRDVKIWVTAEEIDAIDLSGSGTIVSETPIRSDELDFRVSGSGKIRISELQGDELDASLSGSGNIFLEGTAGELGISISGSGSMKAGGLKVNKCDARISGSGSCEVDATGELNAVISGSGRVTYYSNPQVNATVSGSGKVRKAEK
jgi:hypothetical protein